MQSEIGWVASETLFAQLIKDLTTVPFDLLCIIAAFITPRQRLIHHCFQLWIGEQGEPLRWRKQIFNRTGPPPRGFFESWNLMMRQGISRSDMTPLMLSLLHYTLLLDKTGTYMFLPVLFWSAYSVVDGIRLNQLRCDVAGFALGSEFDTLLSWKHYILSDIEPFPALLLCLPFHLSIRNHKWAAWFTGVISSEELKTLTEVELCRVLFERSPNTREQGLLNWGEEVSKLEFSKLEAIREVILETFQAVSDKVEILAK
jgi:hypothetical protein